MRVLLLSSDIDPTNGWGNLTHEFCSVLYGHSELEFHLLLPRVATVPDSVPYASRVHRVLPAWVGSFRRAWHRAPEFLWPRRPRFRSDLIHSLVEFPFGVLARSLARRAGVPYGISTQGTYAVVPFLRFVDRWLFRRALDDAAFVTAPSRFTADAMRQIGGLKRSIQIVHNGVNFDRLQGMADLRVTRRRFGLPNSARVVLGVGALKERKGFGVLVRAFKTVSDSVPEAHLVIVGKGTLRATLEALARELGIAERVHLAGGVDDAGLVGLYHLCEVYAHLPVNVDWNFEGFGIVYLEASSCGKPVVGSRSGGVPDAVIQGETGFLCQEGNPDDAAAAIIRLLQDRELARRLGERGREFARAHRWEAYTNQFEVIYRSVLNRSRGDQSISPQRSAPSLTQPS